MTLSLRLVSPGQIQHQLDQIWESLETKNTTRACLFNLIFCSQKSARAPYIQKIAEKVVQKFPARVIFVAIDEEAKGDFLKQKYRSSLSSQGEFDVACDYIQVKASGSFHDRVPFVVLPHLLPDLPVYLVWGEDPGKADPLYKELEQFANRLIFDSETATDMPHFATSLLERHNTSHCDIADLNWARMESWREMLSMAFYAKDHLDQIQKAQKITVTYNAQQTPFFCHTQIQAFYLQAWLACQLGWQFVGQQNNGTLFSYTTPAGAVDIALSKAQYSHLPPGLILSVDIETSEQGHYSFKRHLDVLNQITYVYSTPNACTLPSHYIFAQAELGHSLVKEICHRRTSEHFLNVMHLTKAMNGLTLCS